jgi:hypothetical protein
MEVESVQYWNDDTSKKLKSEIGMSSIGSREEPLLTSSECQSEENGIDSREGSLCPESQKKKSKGRKKVIVEDEEDIEESYVRRSTRDPNAAVLHKGDFKKLINRILTNDPKTVILKIKEHGLTDITPVAMNEIIEALYKNNVCQVFIFIILLALCYSNFHSRLYMFKIFLKH